MPGKTVSSSDRFHHRQAITMMERREEVGTHETLHSGVERAQTGPTRQVLKDDEGMAYE